MMASRKGRHFKVGFVTGYENFEAWGRRPHADSEATLLLSNGDLL